MKEQNEIKSGWFEDRDPFTLNRKGKPVAKRHYEVAESIKRKGFNTIAEPFTLPAKENDDEIVVLVFKKNVEIDKEFIKLTDSFMKENPSVEFTLHKNTVEIPGEHAEDLMDFLAENEVDFDVEVKKDDEKDDNNDENEIDNIIEEVQRRRKPIALTKDNTRTANKVGNKEDACDLVSWIKEPGKSDLEDVDTKQE